MASTTVVDHHKVAHVFRSVVSNQADGTSKVLNVSNLGRVRALAPIYENESCYTVVFSTLLLGGWKVLFLKWFTAIFVVSFCVYDTSNQLLPVSDVTKVAQRGLDIDHFCERRRLNYCELPC